MYSSTGRHDGVRCYWLGEKIVEMLQVAGWETGNNIKRNSDNMQFEIVSLGQQCTIEDSAGVVTSIRAEALLKNNFSKVETDVIEELEGWAAADGRKTFEWRLALQSGKVIAALDELEEAHAQRAGLQAITKPSYEKGIFAQRDFPKGSLTLVPFSPTVSHRKKGEPLKGSDVDLAFPTTRAKTASSSSSARMCFPRRRQLTRPAPPRKQVKH